MVELEETSILFGRLLQLEEKGRIMLIIFEQDIPER